MANTFRVKQSQMFIATTIDAFDTQGWVVKVKNFKAKIFLAIKAENSQEGVLRPTTKSWELFYQFLSVNKKKFPTNLT